LKLFQEWREGEIKENDGGGKFNYIVRTFVNVSMYPPVQQYDNKKNFFK
jgi:hypothetical protein